MEIRTEKTELHSQLMSLLDDVRKAFALSDIRTVSPNWYYALMTSMPMKNGPLLVGLNWGVDESYEHKEQTIINRCDLTKEDLGSMSRVLPLCEEYYGSEFISQVALTNYNFFRSKFGSQLTRKDFELCEPIFDKLLELLKPSVLIATSSDRRCCLNQS